MTYRINLTNGTQLLQLLDGTLDTSTSMYLVGKNYTGYGELQQENFIHLLENGANATAPDAPLVGQLWYDTSLKRMKVWDGKRFRPISSGTVDPQNPPEPYTGDTWYDTIRQQYFIWNGTDWALIGPSYDIRDPKTGAFVEKIFDVQNNKHLVTSIYSNANRVAIVSWDSEFTPNVAINGWATIPAGVSLPRLASGYTNTTGNILFVGDATNAMNLGNISPSLYLRSNISNTINGNLTLTNNLYVGQVGVGQTSFSNFSIETVSVDTGEVAIKNRGVGAPTTIYTTINGGSQVPSLKFFGTDGHVEVHDDPSTDLGVVTKRLLDSEVINLAEQILGVQIDTTANIGNTNGNLAQTNFNLSSNVASLTARLNEHEYQLSLRANIANPDFTGIPRANTAPLATSTRQIATTEFVMRESNSIKANISNAGYAREAWVDAKGYFLSNGAAQFTGKTLTTNGSTSNYGAVTIKGETGGWSGINFKNAGGSNCNTLMARASDGYGGIYNRTDNGWLVQWDGSGNFTATGDVTAYSDASLKTNVQTIPNSLEITHNLRGVFFDKDGEPGTGVIAQEVQPHLPMLIKVNENGLLSVAYGNMAGLFIENDKALDNKVEKLTQRVAELERIIEQFMELGK